MARDWQDVPRIPQEEEHRYKNHDGKYLALTRDVFLDEYGSDWWEVKTSKQRVNLDFSGEAFCLETLRGPEEGLMHPGFIREYVQVLNISWNQLVQIDCLNTVTDYRYEFRSLNCLSASHNMLSNADLTLPQLMQLDLSHNALEKMPKIDKLRELQKLKLSHNRIDSDISTLSKNTKLWMLDISSNKFSWKPSDFAYQLESLKLLHITEMRAWPNPFAEHFKEYQFLLATALESLTKLDRHNIDGAVRHSLRQELESMRKKGPIDYTRWDFKVEERLRSATKAEKEHAVVHAQMVPTLRELIECMNKPLDYPDELIMHIYDFEEKVASVWGAGFSIRMKLMKELGEDGQLKFMAPARKAEAIDEFVDKIQQLLGRYESVRDVLIKCLARLMACADDTFAKRCAHVLADWIEANSQDLSPDIDKISTALLQDLCLRCLPGMQSLHESPMESFYAAYRSGSDMSKYGDMEDIAEAACILSALACFGTPSTFAVPTSPLKSAVLKVLMPAICRQTRDILGETKSTNKWEAYKNFDYPYDRVESVSVQTSNVESYSMTRCVRQGFHGYVVHETEEGDDMVNVYFMRSPAAALTGMRRYSLGHTLYVRPADVPKREGDSAVTDCRVWPVWLHGLEIVVAATDDPMVAAMGVRDFSLHEAVILHAQESGISSFAESWMQVASGAPEAFTMLLRLARNLIAASGKAGRDAAAYFVEQSLHLNCWRRLRSRITEGGSPVPLVILKAKGVSFTGLVATLVGVVCDLGRLSSNEESVALTTQVMQELFDTGEEIIYLMLEISADSTDPDPLLLMASLQLIHLFLEHDVTRHLVVQKVFSKLHDLVILLPYIRGPRIGDGDNAKYQDMWKQCVMKYGGNSSVLVRCPELNQPGEGWRKLVPLLQNLDHPLFHRVLLAIVNIIELVSKKANSDTTGHLQNISEMLNKCNREELLISPISGVVTCQDYDVKIQCMQCIKSVLKESAGQIEEQEMGWLIRYLSAFGIGVGKQEVFLREVLDVVIMLIRNDAETGRKFRANFGKGAIRETFGILVANCKREPKVYAEEEEMKVKLSLTICKFLTDCSRPLSGGLRNFLRNGHLLSLFVNVMEIEDRHERPSCRRQLLCTWPGRDTRSVLLPMVLTSVLKMRQISRYRVLVRLADVLQGRLDRSLTDMLAEASVTDESDWWLGRAGLLEELKGQDYAELEDLEKQQLEFVLAESFQGLIDFGKRYFMEEELHSGPCSKATEKVEGFVKNTEEVIRKHWDSSERIATSPTDASIAEATLEGAKEVVDDVFEAAVGSFNSRLTTINEQINEYYQSDLNVYNEKRGTSLRTVAIIFAEYFTSNQHIYESHKERRASMEALKELDPHPDARPNELSDQLCVDGKLVHTRTLQQSGMDVERLRLTIPEKWRGLSESDRIDALYREAGAAQIHLKSLLILKEPKTVAQQEEFKKAKEWAVGHLDVGETGDRAISNALQDFLSKHHAIVYDPGRKTKGSIASKLQVKYIGDLSRCRDASRIEISFPDARSLVECFKELRTRFKILRIKNRFTMPTGLGSRFLLLNVEVMAAVNKFICEIRMKIANANTNNIVKKSTMVEKLRAALRDDCQVAFENVASIAEYLIYRVESRAIRPGDVVFVGKDGMMLEAQKSRIVARNAAYSMSQMFRFEKVGSQDQGDHDLDLGSRFRGGVIRFGDKVRLRNVATNFLIDVGANGNIYSRADGLGGATDELNSVFVVESAPFAVKGGVSVVSWFGGSVQASNVQEVQMIAPASNSNKGPGFILHGDVPLRLKVANSKTYVTVMASSAQGGGYKCQARKNEDKFLDKQIFRTTRGGALNFSVDVNAEESPEQTMRRFRERLRRGYMCPSMPAYNSVNQEGGTLRQPIPTFTNVVRRQAMVSKTLPLTHPDSTAKWTSIRASLTVAAILRCYYALLTSPMMPDFLSYTLLEMFVRQGHERSAIPALIELVVASHLDAARDTHNDIDMYSAHLPAKFLRMISSAFSALPSGGATLLRKDEFDEGFDEGHVLMRPGTASEDQALATSICLVGSYIGRVLAPPLLQDIEAGWLIPLGHYQVVLLREIATAINAMARTFIALPMRTIVAGSKEDVAISHAINDAARGLAADSELLSDPGTFFSNEQRSDLFADLVPNSAVCLLVQAMLYGIHREALAYQDHEGFKSEAKQGSVRVLSSLVNGAIHALCAVMVIRKSSKRSSIDYDVCECLSQAISNNSQMVPRARLVQWLTERAAEDLRHAAQDFLQDLSSIQLKPSERVWTIAFAWTGNLVPSMNGEVATQPVLQRRIVILTSSHNIVMLDAHYSDSNPRSAPSFSLVLFRHSIEMMDKVIVSPRIRQLVGVWWKSDSSTDRSDDRLHLIIFESSCRCNEFRSALKMTVPNYIEGKYGSGRGVHEHPVDNTFMSTLQETCKTEKAASLVSIFFVKSPDTPVASGTNIETLIFSRDAVKFVKLTSFVDEFARRGNYCDAAIDGIEGVREQVVDSDSDNDTLVEEHDYGALDDVTKLTASRAYEEALQLSALKGVHFLADHESRVRLTFVRPEDIIFFSEGDRQRWRLQLHNVLQHADNHVDEVTIGRAKGWTPARTEVDNVDAVKKQLKNKMKEAAKHAGKGGGARHGETSLPG